MDNTFQAGNTIFLEAQIYDESGTTLIDPDSIKLIIYDQSYQKINEFTIDSIINRKSTGIYFYNYTTELTPKVLYYEWNAIIDGAVSIIRDKIRTVFV